MAVLVFTVTLQLALILVPETLTVIVAVPAFLPFIFPAVLTVATEVLLEDQVTDLFVVLDGEIVAVSVLVSPTRMLTADADNVTFFALTFFTVSLQVFLILVSFIFAVIVAVPAFLAVILPLEFTVATFVLLDDQANFSPEGVVVAFKVFVSPT